MRLVDAVAALNARKTSVYGGDETVVLPAEQARRMFVGFDLEYDEVWDVVGLAADTMLGDLLDGLASVEMMSRALWLDGLLTGLMLAEGRASEEARAA